MATATPGPTPNPDAMRFQLDVTLPETMNFTSADAAAGDAFAAAVFAAPGVSTVFGVNDFVTVTRLPGAEWDRASHVVGRRAGVKRQRRGERVDGHHVVVGAAALRRARSAVAHLAVVVPRLLAGGRLAECDAAVLGRHPEHGPVHESAARRVAVDHQQRELLGVRGHARPLEGGRDVVAVACVEAGEAGGVDDVGSRELHRLGRRRNRDRVRAAARDEGGEHGGGDKCATHDPRP